MPRTQLDRVRFWLCEQLPARDETRRMLDTGAILYPQEPVDLGDARVIVHPPGYAVLMAALRVIFGDLDAPLRLTQVIFAAAQAVIVVLIAAELLPLALAIIAGLLTAFSPGSLCTRPRSGPF